MPLDTIEDPFELSSYESVKQDFVIFYASRDDDGKMWCPVSDSVSSSAKRSTARAPYLALKTKSSHSKLRFRTDQLPPHVLIHRHTRTAVSWKISLNALLHPLKVQVD